MASSVPTSQYLQQKSFDTWANQLLLLPPIIRRLVVAHLLQSKLSTKFSPCCPTRKMQSEMHSSPFIPMEISFASNELFTVTPVLKAMSSLKATTSSACKIKHSLEQSQQWHFLIQMVKVYKSLLPRSGCTKTRSRWLPVSTFQQKRFALSSEAWAVHLVHARTSVFKCTLPCSPSEHLAP